MGDKGEELNKRVWQLFEKAGFSTLPNSADSSEYEQQLGYGKKRTFDLFAEISELNIKIIGENKSGALAGSFTSLVNDYKELQNLSKANTVLFVLTSFAPAQNDIDYAKSLGMVIWTENDLLYFETLVDTVGTYAKYEIISSMGLKPQIQIPIENVIAIKICQPSNFGKPLYIFSLTPDFLLKTCVVLRKARGNSFAYQRIVQKERLLNIQRFVAGEDALLPTDIVIHFTEDVKWIPVPIPITDIYKQQITLSRESNTQLGILQIPTKYGSLELIDGQHRLYGFINASQTIKTSFNLVVAGLSGINEEKRISTFVSINDKARRMDANLVAYLKYTPDEEICKNDPEKMAIKIVYNLNQSGPFRKKIRMVDFNNKEKITLKGFAGYELKSLLRENGYLHRFYDNSSSEYIKIIKQYFSIIKTYFPSAWENPEKYIIFQNRGISAFLKLFRSILKYYNRKVGLEEITNIISVLRENTSDDFWEVSKLQNSYIGSQGWSNFHRDIVKQIRITITDFQE